MSKKAFFIAAGILALLPVLALAQTVGTITVNSNLPGPPGGIALSDPCSWIFAFYQVAIFFSGILAFGSIVYGGFLYATAAGNPSRESQGKDWIQNALFGVLLLAGAYLILYTINPNLAGAWHALGWVYVICAEPARAIESFEKMIRPSDIVSGPSQRVSAEDSSLCPGVTL